MNNTLLIYILSFFITSISCNQGPKVISTPVSQDTSGESTEIFSDDNSSKSSMTSVSATDGMHTVKVLEVLPTAKYVYLKVEEGEEQFWIATGKREVNVGESYFYRNGILKMNFESKEHNRIFDKVYLVANIVPSNHGNQQANVRKESTPEDASDEVQKIEREGSIKISELVGNKEKYDGKEVQISGKCSKLNPNIMNRNWIHLKDGSMDDFDLVITSDMAVPEGHIVTMKGTVVLDKDFGSGYKYDLIVENGQIVSVGK